MRDCSTNRAGFDRVLMAVAATFLAVSATSALAQSDGPRTSPAELAIDAAVPRPEPANVPPPTASDFKMDATASTPAEPKAADKATEPSTTAKAVEPNTDIKTDTKPAEVVTAPAAKTNDTKTNATKTDETATTTTATPTTPPATATAPTAEPVKAA